MADTTPANEPATLMPAIAPAERPPAPSLFGEFDEEEEDEEGGLEVTTEVACIVGVFPPLPAATNCA